jgi:HAMP domain-containing protein
MAGPFRNVHGQAYTGPAIDVDSLSPGARRLYEGVMGLGIQGLTATSGYRSPQRNAAVGGANRSQHTHGNAIDFNIASLSEADRARVLEYAIANGARGVGVYPSGRSLHVDVRSNPAAWGPAPGAPYRGVSDVNAYPEWARPQLTALLGGQVAAAPAQAAPARPSAGIGSDRVAETNPTPPGSPRAPLAAALALGDLVAPVPVPILPDTGLGGLAVAFAQQQEQRQRQKALEHDAEVRRRAALFSYNPFA